MAKKNILLEGVLIAGGLIGSVYCGVNGVTEQYGLYKCGNKRQEITNELVEKGLSMKLNEQELNDACKQISDYRVMEKNHSAAVRDYSVIAVPFFISLVSGVLLNKKSREMKNDR